MYNSIFNPVTQQFVKVNSKEARALLRKYLHYLNQCQQGGNPRYGQHLPSNSRGMLRAAFGARQRQEYPQRQYYESNQSPTIIATVGLPASGKDLAFLKTIEMLGLDSRDFVQIRLDNFVENDEYYKQRLYKLLGAAKSQNFSTQSIMTSVFSLDQPSALRSSIKEAFKQTRQSLGCLNLSGQIGCESVMYTLLKKSLRNKSHIHIDVNGTSDSSLVWFLQNPDLAQYIHKNQYKLVYSFPLCTKQQLFHRNISRAITQTNTFLKSMNSFGSIFSSKAPRFTLFRYKSTAYYSVLKVLKNLLFRFREMATGNYSYAPGSLFHNFTHSLRVPSSSRSVANTTRFTLPTAVLVFDNSSHHQHIHCVFDSENFQDTHFLEKFANI